MGRKGKTLKSVGEILGNLELANSSTTLAEHYWF